jgi:23S rRNA (uracil1939-C5)-methyltransferase
VEPREAPPAGRVRILRLAAGGDGVGKLEDGRTVFVPRTAPGDLVELTAVRQRQRFARGRIARLVEPGPGRTAPRCLHYVAQECGGCQLQHLDGATQLEAKRSIVNDALTRIGRLDFPVPPVIGVDDPWGYRSRITLGLGPGRRIAGFHPLDQPGRVFDLERCEIAAPQLNRFWERLHPLLHLLPPDAEQLVLRLDRELGVHVVVKARGDQAWGRGKRLAEQLALRQVHAAVWWQPDGGAPRVVAGDHEPFPATVFEQVHPALADRVRQWALEQMGAGLDDHVWDLYAGIGETTAALYARGATVESVELDRRAVDLGERRWHEAMREAPESQRPEPAGVIRHVGRAEEIVGHLRDPDLVVVNPPRAGLDRRVTDAVLARRPRRLVYISCDPATLARDLARLCTPAVVIGPPSRRAVEPPYRLIGLQPFDLFPQTAHVETVAVLEVA